MCDMDSEMSIWMLTLLGCWGDSPVSGAALGPGSERPVWMFRYGSGGWERHPDAIAHRVSSLGLGIVDGQAVLTMQCFWGDCGSEIKRKQIGPPVHLLSTSDLKTFEPGMMRLVDPEDRVPIDTEIRSEGGAAVVWYYGTQAGMRGDPAEHANSHGIYRAKVQDNRLVEPVQMISGPGLADPAPIELGNETVVFLTTQPGREIGMAKGTPLKIQRTWSGVSVPHAMVVGTELWLWAQTVREGRMIPVRSKSGDRGQTWTDWEAPLPLDGLEGCGNPVGAVFAQTPVVFCVSEPLAPPRP